MNSSQGLTAASECAVPHHLLPCPVCRWLAEAVEAVATRVVARAFRAQADSDAQSIISCNVAVFAPNFRPLPGCHNSSSTRLTSWATQHLPEIDDTAMKWLLSLAACVSVALSLNTSNVMYVLPT